MNSLARYSVAVLMLLGGVLAHAAVGVSNYNVVWDSPSANSRGSMPIGNGDVALNVWMEKSGELIFYIAKSDAFSENGILQKLGRVRVRLDPNALPAGAGFRQELDLATGAIRIRSTAGDNQTSITVWVDAHRPVVHVETSSDVPLTMSAALELWRTAPKKIEGAEMGAYYELRGSPDPIISQPDTILPTKAGRVTWFHRNASSISPKVLENQHLASPAGKFPDPLLNRTYGGVMRGDGLSRVDDRTLRSEKPQVNPHLEIHLLTAQTQTQEQWLHQMEETITRTAATNLETARRAHQGWWDEFWKRSWIDIRGSADAAIVSQGYALNRWMSACAGRGAMPMKFNGGLFTVDASGHDPVTKKSEPLDADYRAWGSSFWFQNTRHLYWPLLASGDYDLMEPFFGMYRNAMPLAKARTEIYYKHDGVFFNETISFWGLPNNNNFGWKNPGTETVNGFIRRYWQGGLELTAMMLDRYDHTQDREFASGTLLPLASQITTFYDVHWPRDARGKIRFDPAQSLETWHQAVNPLPDIAGLRCVLPRLIDLPEDLTTPQLRAMWKKTLADLPPIPTGPNAKNQPMLLPAEKFTSRHNSENTELYAIFPYRLYGVGLPEIEIARRAYDVRLFRRNGCWSQEGMDAAGLGLAENARASVTANFKARDSNQRFPAFWGHSFDWTPDMDNGGAGMMSLQWMLMQTSGRRILLLPAWPKEWDCDFKLHAPYQTTVEGSIRDGKITSLNVEPKERVRDIELVNPDGSTRKNILK